MSFLGFILKTLVRQKVRTWLTVLGISIGITTVVALGSVVGGLKETSAQLLRAYDSDFIVAQKGASDLSFSAVTEEEWAAVDARDDVERTVGALLHVARAGGNPYFVTVGVRAEDLAKIDLNIRDGRLIAPGATDEVMLGVRAADKLNAGVGETVELDRRTYTVVGIMKADSVWEDSGAFAPLATVQEHAKKPNVVTMIYVKVKPGLDRHEVADAIEDDNPLLSAVADVDEYSEVDQGIVIMDALNIAISALAVGIGAIGVMNTMVMSVFERTREIGILRAVGWSGNRILRMIIGESLALCLIAAAVGTALGVAASRAVLYIPAVGSLLEPAYTLDVFVRALFVAVVVALVGAVYPALRALRLTPMEALRHE